MVQSRVTLGWSCIGSVAVSLAVCGCLNQPAAEKGDPLGGLELEYQNVHIGEEGGPFIYPCPATCDGRYFLKYRTGSVVCDEVLVEVRDRNGQVVYRYRGKPSAKTWVDLLFQHQTNVLGSTDADGKPNCVGGEWKYLAPCSSPFMSRIKVFRGGVEVE